MSRASLDASLVFLAVMSLIVGLLMLRTVRAPHRIVRKESDEVLELGASLAGSLLIAAPFAQRLVDLAPVLVVFLGVGSAFGYFSHRLSMPGLLWRTTQVTGLAVSALWAGLFVFEGGLPLWAELLGTLAILAMLVFGAAQTIAGFAREAVMTNETWKHPTEAPSRPVLSRSFRVSLQLPCYAEPPELVMQTMNRLAALDYDDFEVLVCDNNTKDERLWRPLEAHCEVLNRRMGREVFRFFHVAPLPGAKAGALNFLLKVMDPNAELIGVIDADYYSRPDFLKRLAPFFADPSLGYIQTPHDYRDHEQSDYLTACYWEYMPANKIDWPGVSEYGGAFTIGTMCLLRTEALRRAGGWAEWCLTEDSEVSVRLRAEGYRGLYLGETFGRGLIPETFDDYRKQRYRWTAGPVQQLRRHWRLFLPAPFAPAMPGWTKLLEIARCSTPLVRLGGIVTALSVLVVSAVAGALGLIGAPDVPNVVWVLIPVAFATLWLRTTHRYLLAGCDRPADMLRGEIARAALTYVVLTAGVAGLSSRPLAWRRTPKFALEGEGENPFEVAREETRAGIACLVLTAILLAGIPLWGTELAVLGGLGLIGLATTFFAAPLLVALARRHARDAVGDTAAMPAPVVVIPAEVVRVAA
jgi:cellulose synthase/poly-beta-1,6-N-acetylglucosamine synthase-like glycosyltransferase